MSNPRVSVIMAVYNGERYLHEAVDSIFAQTLTDLELIVVNDASTDRTAELLARYTDSRIRVLHNQHNLGPGPSRNIAIRAARAPFIAIQDADDTCARTRLEAQIAFLHSNPAVTLVGCQGMHIDDKGQCLSLIDVPLHDLSIKWGLLFGCTCIPASLVMRRNAIDRAGSYSEEGPSARYCEDYDLFSRMNRVGASANLAERFYAYRVNREGTSHKSRSQMQRQQEEISRRNICSLLGCSHVPSPTWQSMRKYLCTPPGGSVDFDQDEISDTLRFLFTLQRAFYAGHNFAPFAVTKHCVKTWRLWARHAIALAYKRDGRRSPVCRAYLLARATWLLSATFFPITLYSQAPHRIIRTLNSLQ